LTAVVLAWPGAALLATSEGTVVAQNEDVRALVPACSDAPGGVLLSALLGEPAADALLASPSTCRVPAEGDRPALVARSSRVDGHVVVALQDATAEERLRTHIDQAERLASVGELLSSVAHELNNPLTSVLGFAEILLADDDPAMPRDEITCIRDEAQRCRRIVKNLLDLARADELQMQPLLIQDVIRKVEEFRAYAAQAQSIELRIEVEPDLPFVMGDFHRLVQAVLNLTTNAEYAVNQRGTDKRIVLRAARDADRIALEVEDDGAGVAPELRERIFEPFFTTKPRGRGTGLGLSLVKATAEAHGGAIRVERAASGGARFVMHFPAEGREL
jgi:signal transduction histidine kinase